MYLRLQCQNVGKINTVYYISSVVPHADFKLKCSVVLPVYKRIEFVDQALLSLENQNIDKDLFEVLIISNTEINLSKSYNLNLEIIYSDKITLAGKLAQGILLAKNEVITFLEDDDLYCRDRISDILKCYSDNDSLTYYHNRSIHFRKSGVLDKNIKYCSGRSTKRSFKVENEGKWDISKEDEKHLNKSQADYNLSSMALRKSFISDYVEMLSKLGTRYIDTFMFSISLYRGNSLMIDSKVLTKIRTNALNASQSVEREGESHMKGGYSNDMKDLIAAFKSSKILDKKFSKNFIIARGFDDLMKGNKLSRTKAIFAMFELSKLYGFNLIRSDVAKKGIVYLISPRLMHKILTEFHKT